MSTSIRTAGHVRFMAVLFTICSHPSFTQSRPYPIHDAVEDYHRSRDPISGWIPLDVPSEISAFSWYPRKNTATSGELPNHAVSNQYVLKFLNRTVVCNDGSRAGYYFRLANNQQAKNWIIFLEGGWYCFSNATCHMRGSNAVALFSSRSWSKYRAFDGILSPDPRINPIYHAYHSVFIPYCSSDLWTGKSTQQNGGLYFQGSRILQAVVDELPFRIFGHAEKVIFAGSSAGGIGVLMNIDRLSQRVQRRIGRSVLTTGIVDSAWFVHIPSQRPSKCVNVFECSAEDGLHRGLKLWKPRIPKSCRAEHPKTDRWKCYLAPYLYKHIKTPVYIVQSLFDEAQMQMSKLSFRTDRTRTQWNHILNLGTTVAESLKNIRGVFAPSCIDHELLTKNDWIHKAVGSIGLIDALKAWDRYLFKKWKKELLLLWGFHHPQTVSFIRTQYLTNEMTKHNQEQAGNLKFTRNSTILFLSRLVSLLGRSNTSSTAPAGRTNSNTSPAVGGSTALTLNKKKEVPDRENNLTLSARYLSLLSETVIGLDETSDFNNYHVIDSCGLSGDSEKSTSKLCAQINPNYSPSRQAGFLEFIPQCNPTCTILSNPFRMKLFDVLASFNFDKASLADAIQSVPERIEHMSSAEQVKLIFCRQLQQLTRRAVYKRDI